MAIAKMERLTLTFKAKHLDRILQLMQGFQGVHVETGYESSIPPALKAEADQVVRETEKSLQEIQAAYRILKGRESANLLSALKNSAEKQLSIAQLTKIVEESNWETILNEVIQTDRQLQNNRTRRLEITSHLNELKRWEPLAYNPLDFKKLHRTTAMFGSVHEKHVEEFIEALAKHEEDGIYFEKMNSEGDRVYFFIVYHNSMSGEMNVYVNEFSFSAEEYRFEKNPAEAIHDLEREEQRLLEEEKEIAALMLEQSKYNEILTFAEDYNLNRLLRAKMAYDVTYDGEDIEIQGWIIAAKREQFLKLLSDNIPRGDYQVMASPVRDKDIDEVPIKLKNGKLVSVYERLTQMYSLPRYDEIDPTPVMTVFYLIFFGMMVADCGYGLTVCLVGLFVRKYLKVKRSTKSFVDFLYYLSFPIMGWGLIFGSFFGIKLPFGLLSITVDIIFITLLAIVLGYFHIMAGLVLHILNQIKLKKYYDMMAGGLSWFLTFLGGGFMLLDYVAPWSGNGFLFWTSAFVTGIGLLMVIVVPAVQYGKRWYAGVGKGLYALYGATSYLGDFVSFTRLMALSVAGGSVALAFNTILDYLPLPARLTFGVVLFVVLHGLNIFLTMLSAYVHGIRLQFIEFFGKFYTGGGRKFEPFKAAEKNVIITGDVE